MAANNAIPITSESHPNGDGATKASSLFAFNGGGPPLSSTLPSALSYDQVATLQGKFQVKTTTCTATAAGDTTLAITSGDADQMYPGAQLILQQAPFPSGEGSLKEAVYITDSYIPAAGVTTVPLKNAVVHAGQTNIEWDQFNVKGPLGPSGIETISSKGIIPFAIALWDKNTQQYSILGNANTQPVGVNNAVPAVQLAFDSVTSSYARLNGNGNGGNAAPFPPASYTGTQSADIINVNYRGMIFFWNITNINGATLTMTIYNKSEFLGSLQQILQSVAIAANGLYVLTVFPGATAVNNQTANSNLARIVEVKVTGSSASTWSMEYEGTI